MIAGIIYGLAGYLSETKPFDPQRYSKAILLGAIYGIASAIAKVPVVQAETLILNSTFAVPLLYVIDKGSTILGRFVGGIFTRLHQIIYGTHAS